MFFSSVDVWKYMETDLIAIVTWNAEFECFDVYYLEVIEVNFLADTGSILTQNVSSAPVKKYGDPGKI